MSQNDVPVAVLGQLIPAAWRAVSGKAQLPSNGDLAKLLLAPGEEPPPSLHSALEAERTVIDFSLKHMTEIIASGQDTGCWARQNPRAVKQHADLTYYDALERLADLEIDYPQEVAWVKNRVASYLNSGN